MMELRICDMAGQDLLPITITDKKGGELCRHQTRAGSGERQTFSLGHDRKNDVRDHGFQ